MTHPNARKGKAFERDVSRYLAAVFSRQVRRPHQEGRVDVGDLHISPFALQCKNYAAIATALNVGVASAEVQAANAHEHYGAAVLKKRGANIADARVAMTLRTFRAVLARLRAAELLLQHHAPDSYHTHLAKHGPEHLQEHLTDAH